MKTAVKPRTIPTVTRGQRFGAVTVLMQTKKSNGEAAAVVRCDHGNVKTVRICHLHADIGCKCRKRATP